MERPFLVAKSFNTNLVQFLPPYHVIIDNAHVCYFTCTISHVHGRAPKTILSTKSRAQKIIIYEGLTLETYALKVFKVFGLKQPLSLVQNKKQVNFHCPT